MNKFFKNFSLLAVVTIFITACDGRIAQTQPVEKEVLKVATYQDVLGKSLDDNVVSDFLAHNHCLSSVQFELCQEIGVALLIASNQIVETVYLYLNNVEGFGPYQGELPFGLKFYDTMGAVEYKLSKKGIGSAGLPDSGGTPDHLHYWANYRQVSLTIIYNSPSAEDEDAAIYAILVSQ
jgi:hypothetical protein